MQFDLATERLRLTFAPDVAIATIGETQRCGVYYLSVESVPAGAISLTSLSRSHGEIGYEIAPSFRGQGFATEGVSAVVSRAVEDHGFSILTARTRSDNIASRRVLEKTGFEPASSRLTWPESMETPVMIVTYARLAPAHDTVVTP